MVQIFLSVCPLPVDSPMLTITPSTGATGYIGGDVLSVLVQSHPEYHITCLARSTEKALVLTNSYPSLSMVLGNLDDSALLTEQAAKADIVCHLANCEHLGAVQAISSGFSQLNASHSTKAFIHLSGADILCFEDVNKLTYGTRRDRFYDDLQGVDDILSLPNDAPHQDVDSVVMQLNSEKELVKTAIVCPPAIYGAGRGPGNRRSIQVPELVSHTLRRKAAFMVGGGENRWATVHIQDLSQIFLKLLEDAATEAWQATWGRYGFYFAGSGLVSWGDVSKQIAQEAVAQGFLEYARVDSLTWEEADQVWEFSSLFLGTNSLCTSNRARKMLGWIPRGRPLSEEIRALVVQEAAALGLQCCH